MKKISILVLVIATSFSFGFAFKTIISKQSTGQTERKKVTGIGGIFFKCKDPKRLREWYETHLGLNTNQYVQFLNGTRGLTAQRKGFCNGALSEKQRNTLSLPQKII